MNVAGFVVKFASMLAIGAYAGCGITVDGEALPRATDDEQPPLLHRPAASTGPAETRIIPAAARSVVVELDNHSDRSLTLVAFNLDHGCSVIDPPGTIDANSTVVWESESCGFLTGTEGEVTYQVNGESQGATAHFHWDNPFVGSNSYDESAPTGYIASHGSGSGNNAVVTFSFGCSSTTCDGIPDDWKKNGVFIDSATNQECPQQNRPATCQFIDLPAMGADVTRPEIFLQIDWMADNVHSHQLSKAAIQAVVDAFVASPYQAVNGAIGITVHVDGGANSVNFPVELSKAQQLAHVQGLGTRTAATYSWTAFDDIKNAPGGFTSTGRGPIFHYIVSAHNIANLGNSGVTRGIPSSDFIISLGSFAGTQQFEQGTLMHELGHNLNLGHGGVDGTNNKPNYFSVMNYSFQLNGLIVGGAQGTIDYSRGPQPDLDETQLDEINGLGPHAATFGTLHWCPQAPTVPGLPPPPPAAFVTVLNANGPIDWNCDGTSSPPPITFDVNNNGKTNPPLAGANDWGRVILHVGAIGGSGEAPPMETALDETLTPETQAMILPSDDLPPVTVASLNPAANTKGWNRTTVAVTLTASDDISGVAAMKFNLDNTGFGKFTGPFDVTAEGVHSLEYFSVDQSQNQEPAHHAVVQIDLTSPMLSCPSAVTLECSNGSALGTFDVTATDNLSGVGSLGCTFPSGSVFPFGTTLDTCSATDLADNIGTCQFNVSVQDTKPPVISRLAPSQSVLWPPNHRMIPVAISPTVSDICDSAPTCTIVGVTSNEPVNGPGDGNTDPDWVITGALSVSLRAERAGNGTGRTYRIAVLCSDFAGNGTTGTATVSVPHSAP